jgi:methionyl-tRNA formyltransferase
MQVAPSPVKRLAEKLGLPVLQPRRVRSEGFLQRMRDLRPEALALAAFGQIIPRPLLDLPPLGPINVHGSLLPRYRGAAPIQRAIMAGETETGVTTMWMDTALDTGDMLLAEAVAIQPDDDSGTLTPRLAAVGARLLVTTLDGLAAGTLPRRPQDEAQATYAPAIRPEDGEIRWTEPADAVCNRVRGVSPRPGAFASIQGRRVKIWRATPVPLETPSEPGSVVALSKSPPGVVVAAGAGAVLLAEAQPENGRRMPAADWARGLRLMPGSRFDTPRTIVPTEPA